MTSGAISITMLASAASVAADHSSAQYRHNSHREHETMDRTSYPPSGIKHIGCLCVLGAICALGGIHLAYDQHRFESGMSGGRGFIALAAVVLSGWRHTRAAVACIAFGFLEALQIVLQDVSRASQAATLIQLLPYVATLAVLALGIGRAAAPRGLGKHADA